MKKSIITVFVLSFMFLFQACDDSDTHDNSECGDNFIDVGEECDGMQLNDKTCSDFGYYSGNLACTSSCTFDLSGCTSGGFCGNGTKDDEEECEGTDFGGKTCTELGYYGGSLACNDNCTLDFSDCISYGKCGDGIINGEEDCDGTELGGKSCTDLGYSGGEVSCNSDCTFNTSSCAMAGCGNNIVEDDETCDGSNFAGNTCETAGYYSGELQCTGCQIDYSGCTGRCGDGIINGDEVCDGTNVDSDSCEAHGFYFGELICSDDCSSLDLSVCYGICGDGMCDSVEDLASCEADCNLTVQFGSSSSEIAISMTSDSTGNLYVTGLTYGAWGGQINHGNSDMFLSKIDPSGNIVWTVMWGGLYNETPEEIAIDSSGNLYIAGHTYHDSDSSSSGWLLKYNIEGSLLWSVSFQPDSKDTRLKGVTVDPSGNIYVSGETAGDFSGTNSNAPYQEDLFALKLNPSDGSIEWYKEWYTDEYETGEDISYYDGYLYLAGSSSSSSEFGTQIGDSDFVLIKLDVSGNEFWTLQDGTSGYDLPTDLYVDSNGIYIVGDVGGIYGNSTADATDNDILMLKYDLNGTLSYYYQVRTPFNEMSGSVTKDASGYVYLSGMTQGVLGAANYGNEDIFVIKLTENAGGVTEVWTVQKGNTSTNGNTSIYTTSGGHIYLSGSSNGSLNGQTPLGEDDAIIMQVK